jgi:dolichyl-phosphate-mannose--protein O-mannosyl transferase
MDAIKAILSKNSIAALVIGTILVILGAASDFTIGTFTYNTPDIFGRIIFVLLGASFIGFGFFFTYLEYKTSNPTIQKGNSSRSIDESQSGATIKYRDTIKLIHLETKATLHSHNKDYHHVGSSKQQEVTGFGGADKNDYWIVKGPNGKDEFFNQGMPVKNGDIIRLEHAITRKNLHSEARFTSPVAHQQEVSAFSPQNNGVGNLYDNWQLEVENGGLWKTGIKIRLIHDHTKVALHSHTLGDEEYTSGQQEVTGFQQRDENDLWSAEIVKT